VLTGAVHRDPLWAFARSDAVGLVVVTEWPIGGASEVVDAEVVDAFQLMARTEGIIPALECAHALAWIVRAAPEMQGQTVLMNLSGRGDKDVAQMMDVLSK
jgi:tryptophan synthase beta subunit